MRISGDILVVGLGRSGEAVALYLARLAKRGEVASVTVADESCTAELSSRAEKLRAAGVTVALGAADVAGPFALAVVSPGLAPSRPLMRSALEHSARVVSEIEFAFERSHSPWIAVTGTNGKTTTTSLVSHLLTSDGIPSETVGNIGRPAIDVVDGASEATAIVAEVSSFQLAFTQEFHPRVSVFLNLTPDHLDWHGSMEAYAADKAKVFSNQGPQDFAVVDVDDPGSAPYAELAARQQVRVSRVTRLRPPPHGAGLIDGMLVLDTPHGLVELIPAKELQIKGEHNVSNALAAAAAAHAFGVHPDAIRSGLRTFKPIEHRLEPVGDVGGVEYFNDSKATNPDAVLKALTAFAERPLIVLLGGRNKGNDFEPLAKAVSERAKAAVLFGESLPEMQLAFEGGALPVRTAPTMRDAVEVAAGLAAPGDAVLLSPACASFDEFANYEERGDTFRGLVQAKISAAGHAATEAGPA